VDTGDSLSLILVGLGPWAFGLRRERFAAPRLAPAHGYLAVYRRSVQSMSTGAVLIERSERRERG